MLPNGPQKLLKAMKKKPTSFFHLLNNKIGDAGVFSDGIEDGLVAFYDLEMPRPTPLTGETLAVFTADLLADETHPAGYWRGYLVGWSAGLAESNPDYFFLEVRAGKDDEE